MFYKTFISYICVLSHEVSVHLTVGQGLKKKASVPENNHLNNKAYTLFFLSRFVPVKWRSLTIVAFEVPEIFAAVYINTHTRAHTCTCTHTPWGSCLIVAK